MKSRAWLAEPQARPVPLEETLTFALTLRLGKAPDQDPKAVQGESDRQGGERRKFSPFVDKSHHNEAGEKSEPGADQRCEDACPIRMEADPATGEIDQNAEQEDDHGCDRQDNQDDVGNAYESAYGPGEAARCIVQQC